MSSHSELIEMELGVVLRKVTLYSGSNPISQAFTVESKRTPEVKSFANLEEANIYFKSEINKLNSIRR